MNIVKELKKIYRRLFLTQVNTQKDFQDIFQAGGGLQNVTDRSIMLGNQKMRIKSLDMEAAAGTVETIISLLKDLPKTNQLLDYGCGQHQSKYLRNLGFQVHSCDILPFNLENFTQIDPNEKSLPFADNQFDISIISEVIEHVENPWDLLLELKRVTKDKIIVTTPNIVSKKSKEVFSESGYFYWFTPDVDYHITPVPFWQLENFCKRHGIKISRRAGNHEIFGLLPAEPMLDNAEVLIYELDVRDGQ